MDHLAADSLFQDPRVKKAKELLHEALRDAQKELKDVKPKQHDLSISYAKFIEEFTQVRGSPLYFPYIGSGIGNGALVELLDGSVKYDFIGGIGPYYFGHSDHGLLNVNVDSAISNTIMQGNLQQNLDPLRLMEKLIKASAMDHCFLSSSGALAAENGLKVAFQYKKSATRVLAFEHCFMGRTLALAQITDKAAFRHGLPNTLAVDYIPFYDPEDPQSTEHAVNTLKKYIQRYPGLHGAMCFELVQGEGGFNVGTRAFFVSLMNVLREANIPILVDEIQTFGRTPMLFAFQYFDLTEYVDIVTVGKMSQTCATLYKKSVKPAAGLLGQTFTASTSAIKASLYILDQLLQGHILSQNEKVFEKCSELLSAIQKKHPGKIHAPSGIGSMFAFSVFNGDSAKTTQFVHKLFEEGLIAFTAGIFPMKIRMLLPVPALKEGDLEKAFEILEKVLCSF